MDLSIAEKAVKSKLKNITIQRINLNDNDVVIELTNGRHLSIERLINKGLSGVSATTSVDLRKKDTSAWMNDESSIDDLAAPKPVSLHQFDGETIVDVGFYYGPLKGKTRLAVSLTTKNDPQDRKAKSKTIAFGMFVAKGDK